MRSKRVFFHDDARSSIPQALQLSGRARLLLSTRVRKSMPVQRSPSCVNLSVWEGTTVFSPGVRLRPGGKCRSCSFHTSLFCDCSGFFTFLPTSLFHEPGPPYPMRATAGIFILCSLSFATCLVWSGGTPQFPPPHSVSLFFRPMCFYQGPVDKPNLSSWSASRRPNFVCTSALVRRYRLLSLVCLEDP